VTAADPSWLAVLAIALAWLAAIGWGAAILADHRRRSWHRAAATLARERDAARAEYDAIAARLAPDLRRSLGANVIELASRRRG